MTREERIEKLRHLITCMKCEVSGKPCDNNCPTQYYAGNMGEIIENLEEIAKALEQEPCEDTISRQAVLDAIDAKKSEWIPVSERLPKTDKEGCSEYILLSFGNFTVPCVGRYEVDKDGSGAFYVGDDEMEAISCDLIVNAWMPLPEPYREGEQ